MLVFRNRMFSYSIVKILLAINFPRALLERFLSILNIRIKFKFQKNKQIWYTKEREL